MLTIARNKFFSYYLPTILSVTLIIVAGFFWLTLQAPQVLASIALDNKADLGSTSATSLTVPYTNTGSILFVTVQSTVTTVSSVSYAGVSMTKLSETSFSQILQVFMLTNPANGTNNVVATAAGGSTYFLLAISYSGVSLVGEPDVSVTTTGNIGGNTTANNTLTTLTANSQLVLFERTSDGLAGIGTCPGGTVELSHIGGICDALTTTLGSYTIGATNPGSGPNRPYEGYMVALKPFPGGYRQSGGKYRQVGGRVSIGSGLSASFNQIALVGTPVSCTGVNSCTTAAMDTRGATLLVADVSTQAPASQAVSDSNGNTWTKIVSNGSGFWNGQLWYAFNNAGSALATSSATTFTASVSGMNGGANFYAFSGTLTGSSNPLDQSSSLGSGGTTFIAPGPITPPTFKELFFTGGGFASGGTLTVDSGFTTLLAGTGFSEAYLLQGLKALKNPTWSTTGAANKAWALMATFKALPK